MSEQFLGEIRMFAGNFAPTGWAFCNGSLIAIAQNNALFTLVGTTYGGDGESTFALPDLRGRVPVHWGDGPGLSSRTLGEKSGEESVTLVTNQMPSHNHSFSASDQRADSVDPGGATMGVASSDIYSSEDVGLVLHSQTIGNAGGGQPHNNMQPYLCVSFIISLVGIMPSSD